MGQPPAVAFRLADSPLHGGGQGSISLEYQTYTSAYLFDTLLTVMWAAGVLHCMPYFTNWTESLDGKTPLTFLLSQNQEIYVRWQILTRVVNFCPYQICLCPCDTKLKLIPQYSWVEAKSRFYNHAPRALLNRRYSLTFTGTTGKHFYIRCCFSKSSTKFSLYKVQVQGNQRCCTGCVQRQVGCLAP